ncbi:MAG: hypothetical protein Kow00124_18680 [Anaerolineae bacterium]
MVPVDGFRRSRLLRVTPLRRDVLIALAGLAAQAIFLAVAPAGQGGRGFPLDDSWIYQTYARSLLTTGRWAFVPGVPSTGSTSLLWTPLLAPGHLPGLSPYWWTQLAGWLALTAAALGAARLAEGEESRPAVGLAAGLAVALCWQMVWAAASGMETALFAALLLWFWGWVRRHDPTAPGLRPRDSLLLGLWAGLLMLARPEGVLAPGVAGVYGLLTPLPLRERLRRAALAGLGFSLILLPFFGMNLLISGSPWPNTFYAKQTEYAILWGQPYLLRLAQQAGVSFVGAQALLIPALVYGAAAALRSRPRRPAALLPLIWVMLHWALYAARLPVTYQHGRYAMPTVAVLMAVGVAAMLALARPAAQRRLIRIASRAWLLAFALTLALSAVVLGAPAYGRDVAFIDGEMVAAARWLAANTPEDAVVAAHDIGAIGYFAPRPLIDLAGLVSPEVIPFMHDDRQLAEFVITRGADYLVIFPRWSSAYQHLASDPRFCPVWDASQGAGYGGASRLGPMTVYAVCGR